jgi:hypothetical protein
MPIVRVVAVSKEQGVTYKDFKVVLLCGVDDQRRITDGEWFGYVKNESVVHPFLLVRGERFMYGGEEHSFEQTNIGTKSLEIGSQFTLVSSDGEHPYEITSVYVVEG